MLWQQGFDRNGVLLRLRVLSNGRRKLCTSSIMVAEAKRLQFIKFSA